jgi:hypothetical protein
MKKIFTLAVLMLFSLGALSAPMPKWVQYHSEGEVKYYYDSANITKGKYILVPRLIQWDKKDGATTFERANLVMDDVSTVSGINIDCPNKTFKTLWVQDYNGTMATGVKLKYRLIDMDWRESFSPDVIGRVGALSKIICK